MRNTRTKAMSITRNAIVSGYFTTLNRRTEQLGMTLVPCGSTTLETSFKINYLGGVLERGLFAHDDTTVRCKCR